MGKHLKEIRKELIFAPATMPFHICHASNICRLNDGTVLAAWFAGSAEGAEDVAIWSARRDVSGWSAPTMVAHDCEESHWNPVIFQKETGEVLLFYKVGNDIKAWYTNLRVSHDQGRTGASRQNWFPEIGAGAGLCAAKLSSYPMVT